MQCCFWHCCQMKWYTHHCVSVCKTIPLLNVNNVQSFAHFHPFYTSKNIPGASKEGRHLESFHPGESLPIKTLSHLLSFHLKLPTLSLHTVCCMATNQTRGQPSLPDHPQEAAFDKRTGRAHTGTPLEHLAMVMGGESPAGTHRTSTKAAYSKAANMTYQTQRNKNRS